MASNAADWTAAIGQIVGAAGTLAAVGVALWIALTDRRRNNAERADRDAAQARLITIAVSGTGALSVDITNRSGEPIFQVQLDQVQSALRPDLGWIVNQNVRGASSTVDAIDAGDKIRIPIWFVDESGKQPVSPTWMELLTAGMSVSISFQDAHGLHWRRTNNGKPDRVLEREPVRWSTQLRKIGYWLVRGPQRANSAD